MFSVLVPHYAEKILLPLADVLRADDALASRVTLLEYLKGLHSHEWSNYVRDCALVLGDRAASASGRLSLETLGITSTAPEEVLRLRIWASLRSQTVYRTVSGFMNYKKALRVLHKVENPAASHDEAAVDALLRRKFHFVLALQNYAHFSEDERADVDTMLAIYPDLRVAYLSESPDGQDVYSVLFDGRCSRDEQGEWVPRFRIKVSVEK